MKRIFIIWIFILPSLVFAQQNHLMIEGTAPNLFINHQVVPKDNYYSIGRLYNVGAKEIAAYNKLEMDNGLNLGQAVKIPLSPTNFTQKDMVAADEALIPVYYAVKPKEGLYRVSVEHNKLPLDVIKKWNKLSSDEINAGNHLVVGFLKVKKDVSDLAKNVEADQNNDAPATMVEDTPKEKPTLTSKEAVATKDITTAEASKKEEEDVAKTEAVKINVSSKDFDGGVFKALYSTQHMVDESGQGAVFKSTSGWEDGKYYCLHNDAQPQTIIKITNNATGKTIYAKVMDVMPDIRQNKGIVVLISNAAADQLGVLDNKFDCSISYSK